MATSVNQLLHRFVNGIARPWRDSYRRLKRACPVRMPSGEDRTISVAIPHYNGAKMAHLGLFNIVNDPRVAEIVVLDDGSKNEEFAKLKAKLKPFSEKVKLFRRDVNWGAFANKIQTVELCSSDWVVLLDYDNSLLPIYLQTIFNIEDWDKSIIYCPGYAYPRFDFRGNEFQQDIDLDRASSMANSSDFNGALFNVGNYFLHRETFVQCNKPFADYCVSVSDVIFANYLWLSAGNRLRVLRDSRYIHRVHGGSTWLNNKEESMRVYYPIVSRFKNKKSPYDESMNDDFDRKTNESEEPRQIRFDDD